MIISEQNLVYPTTHVYSTAPHEKQKSCATFEIIQCNIMGA